MTVAPLITGQQSLFALERTALTIVFANLTVVDTDSHYPTGFTLTVQSGANYTVNGAAVTPATGFLGTLSVPVRVNDGTADSNIFNLSICVASAGIHNVILEHTCSALARALITDIPTSDTTRAGVVKIGANQGDPSPDKARILFTLYANDPDTIAKGGVTGMRDGWDDEIESIEIGGATTHTRRFTIKGEMLFVESRETEDRARAIASIVRERVEKTLLKLSYAGASSGSEYVARGCNSEDMSSEMLQAGGPPDAFQYEIKVRFSVLTTRTGV